MVPSEADMDRLSAGLLALEPGPLAELRRMDPDGVGTPVFWRLAFAIDPDLDCKSAAKWMQFLRMLAILTPAGRRTSGERLHEAGRSFGTVLCDGGDLGWPGGAKEPQPFLSEARLARLLATTSEGRAKSLERTIRMLARNRVPQSGVNCCELARLLFFSGEAAPLRDLAQSYYRRLDSALRQVTRKGHAE